MQDFKHGEVWTDVQTQQVIRYLQLPRIAGLSLLGGEPMQNAKDLARVIKEIKKYSDKSIWCWSGFTLEQIMLNEDMSELLREVDVLIDGKFVEKKKDLNLRFRGSSNQRIIKVQETLQQGEIVLYE